ncbi:MAG: hypothetical protein KC729_09065, partial [Candidatus Eisenbacteria bacterium]|nr:hypothetical protein [Candidatus Eisenbacteria bacterium]
MTKSICVAVLALGVLGALEPDVAAADEVLLYDVDFGSPPHTVGLPPVTGSGAAPRETPTSIPFGDPTVVSALAGLTDQPCAFGNGTFGYDQLQFRIGGTHEAVLEDQDLIRIEMDVVISSLESGNFTILCDVPDVHNVIFHPGGTIGSLPSGLLAFYEYDIPVHVTIEIGFFAPSQW